jgi:hypothetical protein
MFVENLPQVEIRGVEEFHPMNVESIGKNVNKTPAA